MEGRSKLGELGGEGRVYAVVCGFGMGLSWDCDEGYGVVFGWVVLLVFVLLFLTRMLNNLFANQEGLFMSIPLPSYIPYPELSSL